MHCNYQGKNDMWLKLQTLAEPKEKKACPYFYKEWIHKR
jgi:hypothetical protein